MKTATVSAHGRAGKRRIWLVLSSVSLLILGQGCSGWSSLGRQQTAFSGAFWNRSGKADSTPRYDSYADAAALARPDQGGETVLANQNQDQSSRPKDKSGTRAPKAAENQDQPALEPPVTEKHASRGRDPKTSDGNIRVTLGRPEGLATAADSEAASRPMLASGATPRWKRAEDAQARATEPRVEHVAQPERSTLSSRPLGGDDGASPRVAGQPSRNPTGEETLKALLSDARNRLASLSTYQVNITRVERVGGQLQAEENAILSIRRNPKAVRLEWAEGPSKGREVIYSSAINNRMMYVNIANSSLPIPRMTIPVDSPLVLRNSRHPITEAGFDTIVDGLNRSMEAGGPGREGKLGYKGLERPKGLDQPCHLLERKTPAGETWLVYLDQQTLLPAVVAAYRTAGGELIERYTYRNLRPNPVNLASADAFDPDKRWGESKGWLSRLARNAGASGDAKPGETTTR